MFHVVLLEPEIPHNTGAAGRLALATGATLHLIEPLGFSLDAKEVKRSGLDYWQDVDLKVWESFAAFQRAMSGHRFWYLTTKVKKAYWDADFNEGDCLIFGKETRGLPESMISSAGDAAVTIPMISGGTRSLNLATAVGIVLFEAMRQSAIQAAD